MDLSRDLYSMRNASTRASPPHPGTCFRENLDKAVCRTRLIVPLRLILGLAFARNSMGLYARCSRLRLYLSLGTCSREGFDVPALFQE